MKCGFGIYLNNTNNDYNKIKFIMSILLICYLSKLKSQNNFRILGVGYNYQYFKSNVYINSISINYSSSGIQKYNLIFNREFLFGISNYQKIYLKANILTFLFTKFVFEWNKNQSKTYDNDRTFVAAWFLSFFVPNGITYIIKNENKNIKYGIILAPFSYDYIRFPNNKELSNYVAEIGFPIFFHTKRNQHLSIQLFGGYHRNLASKNVRPDNFGNDNFSIRINISYIWGIHKKNKNKEN